MAFDEYAEHDGLGLAALVAKGEVSPAELVEAAITRVERHNGVLNAVVHKAYDEARATAAGDLPDGPFKGVPFLIKDLGAQVQGWPRTSGSRFAQVAADEADSELVARYRAAGVVLLGKSNTPEFGIPGVTNSDQLGACRNPWNPDHISGGSSGGAASATAAGMVPLAHASDGLGSIRIPAACCGLVGMKITRDRTRSARWWTAPWASRSTMWSAAPCETPPPCWTPPATPRSATLSRRRPRTAPIWPRWKRAPDACASPGRPRPPAAGRFPMRCWAIC